MTHASAEDPQAAPPRAESLAKINAMTAKLRELHVSPPDPYVWSRHRRSQWWAFGQFGRYTVTIAEKFGWAVGDYPWEGAVHDRSGISNEIFVKPTFVDADGHLVPIDAVRVLPQVNYLLTDEMCRDIADRMEQIVAQAASAAAAERARQHNEAGRQSTQNAHSTEAGRQNTQNAHSTEAENAEAAPVPSDGPGSAAHGEAGPPEEAEPSPQDKAGHGAGASIIATETATDQTDLGPNDEANPVPSGTSGPATHGETGPDNEADPVPSGTSGSAAHGEAGPNNEADPVPSGTSGPATQDEAGPNNEADPDTSQKAGAGSKEETGAGPIPPPRRGPLDSEPRLPDFASLIDPTKGSTK